MDTLHVLCVDDDKNICDGIRTMVDNTGVSFASVYSGEKAVEKGKKEYDAGREYSTIILDWKRPGMNAHIAKPINLDTLKTP